MEAHPDASNQMPRVAMSAVPSASTASSPCCASVHVRFQATARQRLQRTEPRCCGDGTPLWAERPLLMARADGTYDLIGSSAHLEGLARWVLSFGPQAEVRGPDRLRRRVAAEARRIWERYEAGAKEEQPR